MSGNQNGRSPRSVALVGPYGSGKSTLFEALMEAAECPVKRPADPRDRPSTTELRLGNCTYLGDRWSVLDCPGSIEFAFETAAALAVCDIAVVVCDPQPARAMAVAPLLKTLGEQNTPHILFINRIDTLEGSVADTIAALQSYAKCPLVLRHVAIVENGKPAGYMDVISDRAYRYRKGQPSELVQIPAELQEEEGAAKAKLVEVLADNDDALLEKVLEDVQPTPDEIYRDLKKDLAAGNVIEVMLGAADASAGVRRLWKALRHDTPSAAETAAARGISEEGAPLAQICKSVYAGHSGKLSYARIWRGTIADGATLGGVRLGSINHLVADALAKIPGADAGEIVAFGRLEGIPTGAAVSPGDSVEALPFPEVPPPVYSLAVTTADRKDDVKLSGALQKLAEEDPTLTVDRQQDTAETVLNGQGEIHLNTVVARLASNYGLKLTTQRPQIAYKETIRRKVHEHGRLKRQTGGHGQFADVKIDIEPRERGAGFAFIDKIVGGSVPRNFIPAVEEGAEEAARKGPFGYPVVDIAVTLLDGQFHSVDSSDMAFKTAAGMAMREGLAAADPVLLEPIDQVSISVPNEFTSRAQRILTSRRGQILGYAERSGWPGWDDVEALVPAAELHDLIIELRSQTLGLGTFRRRFDHLAETKLEARRGAA